MTAMHAILSALLLTAASAFAADIDGKWSGSAASPNGSTPVAYTFKAEGTTLNGTMTAPDGSEAKILDGKIEENKVSFKVVLDINGMPLSFTFTGEVSGAELKLTTDFGGQPIPVTAKKVA
jgi:hypothetical protein